jgi:pantothenate kinase-related protein Tda10
MTAAGENGRLYLEDAPPEAAGFDFELVASALADLFQQPTQGAFVLGLHGPWGSGKTTLM